MIYTNFVELHRLLLHAKFQSHRPSGSGEEDFQRFLLFKILLFQAVSEEKMFEYYGNIHVFCPGVGAHESLGSILFSESLIFSPTVHFLQDFHFK